MQKSVKEDRNLYIGGSDIPVILGISPFKTRYELLLEKAQIDNDEFEGNAYTEYGNVMEDKIRNYINETLNTEFKEDKYINGDIRCHTDGYNGNKILEIKTTSKTYNDVNDYKMYLSQLLFYLENYNLEEGILAVYKRPEDFNEVFDASLLKTYDINIKDYSSEINLINKEVEKFREDLKKLRENPLMSEEDFVPEDIRKLSHEVEQLEVRLQTYNDMVREKEELKEKLYQTMEENNIKSWNTPNGTKITLVSKGEDKVEMKFNEKRFAEEKPKEYQEYLEEKIKKGKKGYVLITLPKE